MGKDLNNFGVVILAAGRGARLNCTDKPKVMLEIGGKPIVSYIIETLYKIGFNREQICIVVGFKQEKVRQYFGDRVIYAEQTVQRGTADAAFNGSLKLPLEVKQIMLLGGDDSAFYKPKTLVEFMTRHMANENIVSLLTVESEDPNGYGRIVLRPNGDIEVIEKEYLTPEQQEITEISTGAFCFNRAWFERIFPTMPALRKIEEYGLPTALAIARQEKVRYEMIKMNDSSEWFGVNTVGELDEANRRKISLKLKNMKT